MFTNCSTFETLISETHHEYIFNHTHTHTDQMLGLEKKKKNNMQTLDKKEISAFSIIYEMMLKFSISDVKNSL